MTSLDLSTNYDGKNIRHCLAVLIFLISFCCYLYALYPGVGPRDSIEIATYVPRLIPLHQPGYPLYVLLGKTFSETLRLGNPIYRLNIFSSLCSSLLIVLIFQISENLVSLSSPSAPWSLALLPATLAGLSPIFISQAVTAEVFSLNALLFASLLFLTVSLVDERCISPSARLALMGFLFGLGLAHHQTLALAFPGLLIGVLLTSNSYKFSKKDWVAAIALTVFGLSIYVSLIPLRHNRWFDSQTWQRLLDTILRRNFGTFNLSQDRAFAKSETAGFAAMLSWQVFLFQQLWNGISPLGGSLVFVGALTTLRRRTTAGITCLATFFFTGPIFMLFVRNLAQTPENGATIARFLLVPILALLPLTVLPLAELTNLIGRRATLVLFIGLMIVACIFLIPDSKKTSRRTCYIVEDFVANQWRSLCPNSDVILGSGSIPLAYQYAKLRDGEHESADIKAFSFNAPISPSSRGYWAGLLSTPRNGRRLLVSSSLVAVMGLPPSYGGTLRGLFVELYPAGPVPSELFRADHVYSFRGIDSEAYRSDPFLNRLIANYYVVYNFNSNIARMKREIADLEASCNALANIASISARDQCLGLNKTPHLPQK